jgi:hypothetical protein
MDFTRTIAIVVVGLITLWLDVTLCEAKLTSCTDNVAPNFPFPYCLF